MHTDVAARAPRGAATQPRTCNARPRQIRHQPHLDHHVAVLLLLLSTVQGLQAGGLEHSRF